MPRYSYQLISSDCQSTFQLEKEKSNNNDLLKVNLWSDHQFRVYLIVLREGKLWSHRLAIFNDLTSTQDYCQNQIQLFSEYQSATEKQQTALRPQLDFSPRRLNLSTEVPRLNFLCLISDLSSECFLL